MLPKPFPSLRLGSIGEPVRYLQQALNLAPSILPRLDTDAQFGSRTHNRVVEYQGQQKVSRDGVVGPITWGTLEPFLQQLLAIVDQQIKPAEESAIRQRIVDAARAAFEVWGWGPKGKVLPDGSARIAAAQGFGPNLGGKRARQGGVALASIFSLAAAGGSKCLTIAPHIESLYQTEGPNKTDILNIEDIPSWCGIFATYCYRVAGLPVTWADVSNQNAEYFDKLDSNAEVQPGDIGVYDKKTNHHFVVVQHCLPGKHVYSIDGNVGNPDENVVSPWNSVISTRFYLRTTLRNRSGIFLRPKFAAIKA